MTSADPDIVASFPSTSRREGTEHVRFAGSSAPSTLLRRCRPARIGRGLDDVRDRHEALEVLGLAASASTAEVKRVYRDLARRHHPDRGGDVVAFRRVRAAYELLVTSAAPTPPTVARGRPSRPPSPDRPDVADIDWNDHLRPGVPCRRDALAATVAATRRVEAVSRAPGARLNPLAPHLAGDFATRMVVRMARDDRGAEAVVVALVAVSRTGRRALEGVDVADQWVRRRGSAATRLETTVVCHDTTSRAILDAVHRLDALLERMHWPWEQWRVIVRS